LDAGDFNMDDFLNEGGL